MASIYIQKLKSGIDAIANSNFIKFLKRNKRTLAIIVIVSFILLFGYYVYAHPEIIQDVLDIGFYNVLLIIILYSGVVLTNVGIVYATIRLCHKNLPLKSSLLLTVYSSVINFFGPLQSGPAVRAVYLKTKIGLRIRDYTIAMIFYYLSYGVINVALLFITKLPLLSVAGIIIAFIATALGTAKLGFGNLKKFVFYILIATMVQIACLILIYFVELNAINPLAHYSLAQAVAYAASANLSLFVSLTPGAIGIREAFLVLSQSLHNIPLDSIVAAGIVDRAIYIFFLILLFIVSSGLHLKSMFVRTLKK